MVDTICQKGLDRDMEYIDTHMLHEASKQRFDWIIDYYWINRRTMQ
jgi:hypothetical protein